MEMAHLVQIEVGMECGFGKGIYILKPRTNYVELYLACLLNWLSHRRCKSTKCGQCCHN